MTPFMSNNALQHPILFCKTPVYFRKLRQPCGGSLGEKMQEKSYFRRKIQNVMQGVGPLFIRASPPPFMKNPAKYI